MLTQSSSHHTVDMLRIDIAWTEYNNDRGSLKFLLRYMALTGWELTDTHRNFTLHCSLVSELPAIYSTSWVAHSSVIRVATLFLPDYGHCCRMRVLLEGSLGVLPILRIYTRIWVRCPGLMQRSLLGAVQYRGMCFKCNAWIYLYFPMFAPSVRPGTEACKPYIQQFLVLGYKNENKLLYIRLRLDVMIADEVRWVPYRMKEIRVAPVMPPQALLDLIAREATREDLEDSEFRRTY
ncbi:hypothetical protein M9H77_13379 [Catharanthus roseus]|uniref:Uncharacterized protein n=1 Tax=Catharanthus roseus TaxID=4058 RepID=A0ACC0BK19_CATRO|nr:hypothetical protein M9H77_13379 [Catharanthus roseus]